MLKISYNPVRERKIAIVWAITSEDLSTFLVAIDGLSDGAAFSELPTMLQRRYSSSMKKCMQQVPQNKQQLLSGADIATWESSPPGRIYGIHQVFSSIEGSTAEYAGRL